MDVNATAQTVMLATGGEQIVYQGAVIFISLLCMVVTYFLVKFLRTSDFAKKYNLDNERTERILANAIAYAECVALKAAGAYIDKKKLQIKYFNAVAPDLVQKYGVMLSDMLERKGAQIIAGTGSTTTASTDITTTATTSTESTVTPAPTVATADVTQPATSDTAASSTTIGSV